jgi:hypothetical protein
MANAFAAAHGSRALAASSAAGPLGHPSRPLAPEELELAVAASAASHAYLSASSSPLQRASASYASAQSLAAPLGPEPRDGDASPLPSSQGASGRSVAMLESPGLGAGPGQLPRKGGPAGARGAWADSPRAPAPASERLAAGGEAQRAGNAVWTNPAFEEAAGGREGGAPWA